MTLHAQCGAELSVSLLLTKNPACSFSCLESAAVSRLDTRVPSLLMCRNAENLLTTATSAERTLPVSSERLKIRFLPDDDSKDTQFRHQVHYWWWDSRARPDHVTWHL